MSAIAEKKSLVRPVRLGFLSTHPIQYYTPLFRALAARADIDLHVYYCRQASPAEQSAAGFGVAFDWDVSLLGGYRHTFLENVASTPSTATFSGMDIPGIGVRIADDQLDALIVNGWHFKGAFQAMMACRRRRIPVLLRSDSHLLTPRSLSALAVKRIAYPLFIRRAAGCLAVGKLAKEYFLQYGASPDRVFVVPHSVDDERITGEARQRTAQREIARAAWHIKPDEIAWLFAGKFISKKRPLDFIGAIAELSRRGSKSVAVMIGNGPLRAECEEYARSVRAPVRFTGFLNQSEIVSGYVAGDALVLPSDGGETWGLVVNEAMLCGLPCFVSDRVGCGPDLIEDGATGAIFRFGDPISCADVLVKYADCGVLARMGDTARGRSRGFSVKTVSGTLTQAVDATLARVRSERRGKTLTQLLRNRKAGL